jgi:glycosyltransferase involved in cell wall biosynthesis
MTSVSKIKIIIPAYNEEGRLRKNVCEWKLALTEYDCILVDDGSTDNTSGTAKEIGFQTVLKHDRNRGKGAAVRTGILKALELGAEEVLFADADLSAGPEAWKAVLKGLDGADIAIGSRLINGAEVKRGMVRELSSRTFLFLRRLLLPIPVMDTQCGCKAFTREAAEKLFRTELQFEGFGFDLEILMHALKLGLKTKEVGIKWIDKHGSKVNIVRDSFKMIKAVYKIRQKSIKEGADAYD